MDVGKGAGASATLVMGIVNVTPDSFSERGEFATARAAIDLGLRLLDEGADILDIGGESTRPGAVPVSAEEEWGRIGEVVETLAGRGAVLSVDTYHSETARRAGDLGVRIVNDVTGGAGDSLMHSTVAATECLYVLQHSRGRAESVGEYGKIGAEVASDLARMLEVAEQNGLAAERIIVDPGFGFAKDSAQCWSLAADLGPVFALGRPVLAGVSRKRFLAQVSRGSDPLDRDTASAALAFHFASLGAWGVRAHNVAATREAVDTAARMARANADCFAAGRAKTGLVPEAKGAEDTARSLASARTNASASEPENAYRRADALNRKPKGERFRLRDLFGRGPGLNSGELWG